MQQQFRTPFSELGVKLPKFDNIKTAKNGVGVMVRISSKNVKSPKNCETKHSNFSSSNLQKKGWRCNHDFHAESFIRRTSTPRLPSIYHDAISNKA